MAQSVHFARILKEEIWIGDCVLGINFEVEAGDNVLLHAGILLGDEHLACCGTVQGGHVTDARLYAHWGRVHCIQIKDGIISEHAQRHV